MLRGGDSSVNGKQFVVAVVLVASLFCSTFVFVSGVRRPTGSFGAIRFLDPNETISHSSGDVVNATIFTWTPNDLTSNAILHISWFLEYSFAGTPNPYSTGALSLNVYINDYQIYGNNLWAPTPNTMPYRLCEVFQELPRIIPNQASYRIRFTFYASSGGFSALVRNINAIVTVADGMIPNEYYQAT